MSSADYTIGDLLAESNLALELVSGNTEALRRPVIGAHSIELENPSKWLDRGWMMLTMGVRLRNKASVQRQLIRELKAIDASCIGFGVGLAFKNIPPALLEEANQLDLPVLLVPEDTQFREIARAIFQSTVGIESRTFSRLSSIQQNLIRAFGDENPIESIVQRLGRLVNAVVAVVSSDGHAVVATGSFPLADVLSAVVADRSGLIIPLTVGEWKVLASPINDISGPSTRWLIVASKRTTVTDDLARAAMQVTLPLLDALLRMTVSNRNQDRAVRQTLLDSILDDSTDDVDKRILGARVSALGLEFGEGVAATVIRRAAKQDTVVELHQVATALSDRIEKASARYLLSVRKHEIVVAHQTDFDIRPIIEELVSAFDQIRVGIGRTVVSTDSLRTAWRDAQIAVQHLSLKTSERIQEFDELDLVTQLLAEIPAERLAAKVDTLTELLRSRPIQLEALRAYFSHSRDIKAAAAAIFLHPNTLRYRLERFEQILGQSLQEPVVIASLYCVLALMPDVDMDAAGSTAEDGPAHPQ